MWLIQSPIQWWAPGDKQQRREGGRSRYLVPKLMMIGYVPSLLHMPLWYARRQIKTVVIWSQSNSGKMAACRI
jgi:hypothetical protein